MLVSWLRRRRRRQLVAKPFPRAWHGYLEQNVRHYNHLRPAEKADLRDRLRVLVAEKHWIGGAGLSLTTEIKVTVAAQACVMLLGFDQSYYFDKVGTIVIHPGTYLHPRDHNDHFPFVAEHIPVYGESWYRGPIVLSWQHVLQGGREAHDGHNVVIHEFAHHLDGLHGGVEGNPPLNSNRQQEDWYRITEEEYFRLVGQARRGEASLLDHYGASNRAEFFAVATECFFERPGEMQRRYSALYGLLREFYQQDPACWLPEVAEWRERPSDNESTGVAAADTEQLKRDSLAIKSPDDFFTLAIQYRNDGSHALAEAALTSAIRLNPGDGEALQHRAAEYLELGRFQEALDDCQQALSVDGADIDAYRTRAGAYVGLRKYQEAIEDLRCVLRDDPDNAEAYYFRGLAWSGLGRWRRAVWDLTRSISRRPFVAEVYYHRGLAQRQLGHWIKAEADLARAFQLDPEVDQRERERHDFDSV